MSMSDEDRPFLAEYAKSGRAACKLCRGAIAKDTLRLAKMVQVSSTVEILIIAHPSLVMGGREPERDDMVHADLRSVLNQYYIIAFSVKIV